MTDQPIVVWTEIPVSNMKAAVAFYNSVFGYDMHIDESGPTPIAIFGNAMNTVGGHIYTGKPTGGQGATVHLAVPGKLEGAVQRCRDGGGTIVSDPATIPPGRFVYARDPDGNSIGLFEPAA